MSLKLPSKCFVVVHNFLQVTVNGVKDKLCGTLCACFVLGLCLMEKCQ